MKKELEYCKMLESAGFTRDQAETHLQVIEGAMRDNVATKLDLFDLRSDLKEDMSVLRAELKDEIQSVRGELKQDIENVKEGLIVLDSKLGLLEQRLINKVGVLVASATGFIGTLITVFKFAF